MSKAGRGKKAAKQEDAKSDAKAHDSGVKSAIENSERHVIRAAEGITTLEAHPDEERPGKVDVVTRQKEPIDPDAVADEARKGYDLMVVGIAKARNPKGGFSRDLSLMTSGFEGPLAVVDAIESRGGRPADRNGRILIPVNGTDVSRRAVEVGLTLARASDAQITALYVTRSSPSGGNGKSAARKRATRRGELAVLKDIAALGERFEVKVHSTTRANLAPDEAILREAKRGYDLIVLGVSRRPGDTLFFGNTAAAVLDRSNISNLFVAS
jgi:nucleotide-binding universal stress UspA family protein